jgi:hypothetical protein
MRGGTQALTPADPFGVPEESACIPRRGITSRVDSNYASVSSGPSLVICCHVFPHIR